MTAYLPLLGRLIEQTTMTHATGQLLGVLSIASRHTRTPSDLSELLDSSVTVYQFRVLSPSRPAGISSHDTIKVAQTSSKLVAVGDILRIILLSSSPYSVVADKTGWTATLISNTVRYMT